MPPKVKVTREEIIDTAVDAVRVAGEGALNARYLAAALGCSTQPIFFNFNSMSELRAAIVKKAGACYASYVAEEVQSGKYPAYKASGMAYTRFAAEEKELFKLLFMRDRQGENSAETEEEETEALYSLIQEQVGITNEEARLFHLEMWATVHGLATMLATGYLTLDGELISRILTDSYQGLKHRFKRKGEEV